MVVRVTWPGFQFRHPQSSPSRFLTNIFTTNERNSARLYVEFDWFTEHMKRRTQQPWTSVELKSVRGSTLDCCHRTPFAGVRRQCAAALTTSVQKSAALLVVYLRASIATHRSRHVHQFRSLLNVRWNLADVFEQQICLLVSRICTAKCNVKQ